MEWNAPLDHIPKADSLETLHLGKAEQATIVTKPNTLVFIPINYLPFFYPYLSLSPFILTSTRPLLFIHQKLGSVAVEEELDGRRTTFINAYLPTLGRDF